MAITPIALVFEGRNLSHFGPGSHEFPWFTAPLKNLSRKHRVWFADIARFNAEMDALEEQGLSDAEEQAIRDARMAELGLTGADLDIFSKGLSVHFSDGSVHRIGPVYYEDGSLRWRNGEALHGEDAYVNEALTWKQVFINFVTAIALEVVAFALMVGLFFAWAAGWFS